MALEQNLLTRAGCTVKTVLENINLETEPVGYNNIVGSPTRKIE